MVKKTPTPAATKSELSRMKEELTEIRGGGMGGGGGGGEHRSGIAISYPLVEKNLPGMNCLPDQYLRCRPSKPTSN